jgi:TPR repeat protein
MLRFAGCGSCPLILFISATLIAGQIRAAEGVRQADMSPAQANPIDELLRDAESGNIKAQYVLGCCFNGEHGCPRIPAEAVKWWGVAAANGHADAQFCLGLSCFLGEGVIKNPARAAKWWRRAADQDQPDAQYFLGLSYRTGLGVPKSTQLAIYWLQKSASHGINAAAEQLKQLVSSPG